MFYKGLIWTKIQFSDYTWKKIFFDHIIILIKLIHFLIKGAI